MRGAICVLVCCIAARAFAETPDELVQQGEALAKDGRYSEAIDRFKAADRADPRASHACLIALAYTRRELWPQAEIFLSRCRERATTAEPVPEWVPLAEQQLQERLATVNVAAVELVVKPASAAVELSVSSFAPDEVFTPRTIHLPPGHHVVTARAPGYREVQRGIDVGDDREPQRVVVELQTPAPKPIDTRRVASRLPWYIAGAGALITGAAITYHATAYRSSRDTLENDRALPDYVTATAAYAMDEPTFKQRQKITFALYGVGLATALTGLALHVAGIGDHVVEVAPTTRGAVVSVGWQR